MFKKFISLEWKQFTRSANFNKSVAIKVLMGIGVFFLLMYAILIGVGLYFIAKKVLPDEDPWSVVNKYLIFWLLGELVIRYLIQKMPVVHVKPLLILPIKRKKVVHYGLAKSLLTIFNFIPLFILLPFSITLIFHGYNTINVFVWFLGVYCITLTLNFVTFLINKSSPVFYSIFAVLIGLIGLEYFEIFKISVLAGKAFSYLSQHSYAI
jgi:hypothetical protein